MTASIFHYSRAPHLAYLSFLGVAALTGGYPFFINFLDASQTLSGSISAAYSVARLSSSRDEADRKTRTSYLQKLNLRHPFIRQYYPLLATLPPDLLQIIHDYYPIGERDCSALLSYVEHPHATNNGGLLVSTIKIPYRRWQELDFPPVHITHAPAPSAEDSLFHNYSDLPYIIASEDGYTVRDKKTGLDLQIFPKLAIVNESNVDGYRPIAASGNGQAILLAFITNNNPDLNHPLLHVQADRGGIRPTFLQQIPDMPQRIPSLFARHIQISYDGSTVATRVLPVDTNYPSSDICYWRSDTGWIPQIISDKDQSMSDPHISKDGSRILTETDLTTKRITASSVWDTLTCSEVVRVEHRGNFTLDGNEWRHLYHTWLCQPRKGEAISLVSTILKAPISDKVRFSDKGPFEPLPTEIIEHSSPGDDQTLYVDHDSEPFQATRKISVSPDGNNVLIEDGTKAKLFDMRGAIHYVYKLAAREMAQEVRNNIDELGLTEKKDLPYRCPAKW